MSNNIKQIFHEFLRRLLVVFGVFSYLVPIYIIDFIFFKRIDFKRDSIEIGKIFFVVLLIYSLLQLVSFLMHKRFFYTTLAVDFPFIPKGYQFDRKDFVFSILYVVIIILAVIYFF